MVEESILLSVCEPSVDNGTCSPIQNIRTIGLKSEGVAACTVTTLFPLSFIFLSPSLSCDVSILQHVCEPSVDNGSPLQNIRTIDFVSSLFLSQL